MITCPCKSLLLLFSELSAVDDENEEEVELSGQDEGKLWIFFGRCAYSSELRLSSCDYILVRIIELIIKTNVLETPKL